MAQVKAKLSKRDARFLEKSLNASMWKVILTVGAPLVLYQGVSHLFTILDTMMAAQISDRSVAAVAYISQLSQLLSAIGTGLSVGAGIEISRAYGEGNLSLVKRRISSLYLLCLSIGALMLLLLFPFATAFLRLAGTPGELIRLGARYFRIQLFTLVATFLNGVYFAVERARGNTGRIMRLNLLGLSLKFTLTFVFIYFLKGGLAMLGAASLLSQLVLFALAVKNSLQGEDAFSFSWGAISLEREVNLPMIAKSLPVILERFFFFLGKAIVNSMCTAYTTTMVGALGVSNNLSALVTFPQDGFKDGSAAVISQNLGAKKYQRVLQAFYCTLLVNLLVTVLGILCVMLGLDFLTGLFDSKSPTFHQEIQLVFRYEVIGTLPLAVNAACISLFYGLGKTRLTLVVNFSRLFLFRIPVFWFLQHHTALGDKSVGIIMMVSNICASLLSGCLGLVVLSRFRKKHLKKEGAKKALKAEI